MQQASKDFIQSPCNFRAIGVMSGTSLDGLDICLADYEFNGKEWSYSILKADTITFPLELKNSLSNAMYLSGLKLIQLDIFLGKWIGENIANFISGMSEKVHIIGSHGHTVFHNPSAGYSTQIGNGAHIAAIAKIPCVCDFRMGDVARGGQGAPLVPIGDSFLFSNFDFCLNIGGIANVSYKKNSQRIAFDICPANMALNHIASQMKRDYDCYGEMGRKGEVDINLLEKLNNLEYYRADGAKSLGKEWFEKVFYPIIENSNLNTLNKLRTVYEHISIKISEVLKLKSDGSILVTGGGAKNTFLVELISEKSNKLTIPDMITIDYKEALIFGFLAVLYMQKIPSCLSSVTGAKTDSIGGCLYL